MKHSEGLIEQAINGDRASQSRLTNLWFKRIYNYAFKYLSDHDLAMEVAQKTFIRMYEKMNELREAAKFKPWLYRIATNYCHEELRKDQTMNKYFTRDDEESRNKKAMDTFYNPDQWIERQELTHFLQQALMSLKQEQREVLIMKEYEGLKFAEIAEILVESENTIKSRLYYGLSHLRKYFEANNLSKETLQL